MTKASKPVLSDGAALKKLDEPKREELGKMVRSTWVSGALSFPDPKPSWLTDWDQLTESQKEVDRLIGTRIYLYALADAASPNDRLKADKEREIWAKAHDAGFLPETSIVIELAELGPILGMNFFGKPTISTGDADKEEA